MSSVAPIVTGVEHGESQEHDGAMSTAVRTILEREDALTTLHEALDDSEATAKARRLQILADGSALHLPAVEWTIRPCAFLA